MTPGQVSTLLVQHARTTKAASRGDGGSLQDQVKAYAEDQGLA